MELQPSNHSKTPSLLAMTKDVNKFHCMGVDAANTLPGSAHSPYFAAHWPM